MARVLLVSKFQEFVGGVEVHLHALARGLEVRGHEVRIFSIEEIEASSGPSFTAKPKSLGEAASSVRAMFWNSEARCALRAMIAEFDPEVVHYHSIYHQLSPAVLGLADCPSVMTLHDFKLIAPCYTLVRNGEVCTDCIGRKFAAPAIKHRCVKGSELGSVICAVEGMVALPRHVRLIDRFIVPSEFARDMFIRGGLPGDQISVVRWGTEANASGGELLSRAGGKRVWLFVGRLHMSKGILDLVRLWYRLPRPANLYLYIAGDGELREALEELIVDDSVQLLGSVSPDVVHGLYQEAELCLVPSVQPETFGLVAIESLSCGTPIVVSGAGALSEFGDGGVLNMRCGVDGWGAALETLARGTAAVEAMSRDLDALRDSNEFSVDSMVIAIENCYTNAGVVE